MKHLTIAIVSFLLFSFDAKASYDFNNKIKIGDLTYCFDDDKKEAQVVDCSDRIQSISIPSSVSYGRRYSVVEIGGSAFYGCSSLTSVDIPSSVTEIDHAAFFGCSSLTSIDIPNSVTKIGDRAFGECLSLTSFTIPKSVTEIGINVFEGCTLLKNLIIENGSKTLKTGYGTFHGFPLETLYWGRDLIDGSFFSDIETLTTVTISNYVTGIPAFTFSGCVGLTSVDLPHSVTTIGRMAFYCCSSLTSLTIPNSVTQIGEYVFSDCSNLKDLIFEDGDKDLFLRRIYDLNSLENLYIGRSCICQFSELNAIESVTIGSGASSISGSFEECPSLKKFIIADSDQELFLYNNLSFPESPLEEIYLGRNVSFGTVSPFSRIKTLTSAVVGNQVTILNDVFADCTSLRSIKFEDGVEMLYALAFDNFRDCPIETLYLGRDLSGISPFKGLDALSSVTISNSVTTIGEWTFFGCTALKSFICSDSVKEIGEYSFSDCTGLTSFNLGNSVENIGFNAFMNCSGLTSMVIPNSVTKIRGGVFNGCVSLKEVIIEDGDEILSWENYSDRGHSFEECPLESLYLGRHIFYEKESPFYGVETLSSVTFGNTVTSIPKEAFKYCTGLTSVTISDSVTEIGRSAFYGCTGLISISIPNSVTTIEEWAFSDCSALTSVIIPKSLSKINGAVFYDCKSLNTITIPNSIDSIDNAAFLGCISLKKLIIEDGSKTLSLGQNEYEKVKGLFAGCPIETLHIGRNLSFPNDISPFAQIQTLDDVTFSNFVTIIENKTFQYCNALKVINIPSSIKEIKEEAFYDCWGIEDVIVEDSPEPLNFNNNAISRNSLKNLNIGRNIVGTPFKYSHELKDITFGNLVTKIDSDVFVNCMDIQNVIVLADNPPVLAENGFEDIVYEKVVLKVPDSSVKEYRNAEGWKKFLEIMGINEEPPTSLKIENMEVNLLKGESIILNVIISPENATNATISWSSSDPAVADVDANGLVTALDRGSAIITASTTNGLTASCSINVTSFLVESIQLTPEKLNVEEGHFYKIEATVFPENASEKTLIWSSSDESVAAVNSEGVVYILKEGECIITASASDGSGVTAECIVTGVAGIDSIFSDNGNFDIYSVNGTLIRKGCDNDYLKTLAPDVYIIRQGNLVKKLIIH